MDFRARVDAWVFGPRVQGLITVVIIFNAVILGVETSARAMAQAGPMILLLDSLCLAIFTVEMLAKLYARRLTFFRNGWNLFDLLVVGVAYLPAGQGFSVLRALRVLRLLRIVSVTPRLRRVVEGFLDAVPGMASVFLLMGLIFYVFAVIATKLFGAAFPEWFGTLGDSAYSLFQIMTLESWSMGIVRPVMQVYPQAWLFFVPFILITTFTVMNLVVGLIVNSMQDAHHAEENEMTGAYRDEVLARLKAIEEALVQQAPSDRQTCNGNQAADQSSRARQD
ncbi:ion transporter [Paracoccus tegillarcae]|uniref:Voltage-gated sodium channel n=1 Tax=Paracoccus tegillarcae TaxID=1529068 RepID=A0A2K9F699_9RHOB|nr:ion transporter [Paracoccus tegillarcae]AUH34701.1 voltage-gated sodium channel [Paracoccus tegillarcae]